MFALRHFVVEEVLSTHACFACVLMDKSLTIRISYSHHGQCRALAWQFERMSQYKRFQSQVINMHTLI